jgi:thiol-disulfide isomerase/thioredoxin
MHGKNFIVPIILTALAVTARADEKLPVLQAGSETYSNVTVTSVSTTDVYFIYAGGMANVKLKKLSPELQKHFSFDPKKAKEMEVKQAENKAKYHDQLIHQPAVQAPDLARNRPAAAAPAGEPAWLYNLSILLKQAQSENKLVLLDFTGSDWCPWCIKFDQDVLSTDKFMAYAGQKLKFVKVDFPRHTPQSDDLKQANAALAKQFAVDGFPTYVLLNSDGRELGRQVGYLNGGPDAFISELDTFSKR